MDIREFSNKLAQATQNMSDEERASLMKMFEAVSGDISNMTPAQVPPQATGAAKATGDHPAYYSSTAAPTTEVDEDGVPVGSDRKTGKTKGKTSSSRYLLSLHTELAP